MVSVAKSTAPPTRTILAPGRRLRRRLRDCRDISAERGYRARCDFLPRLTAAISTLGAERHEHRHRRHGGHTTRNAGTGCAPRARRRCRRAGRPFGAWLVDAPARGSRADDRCTGELARALELASARVGGGRGNEI